MIRNLAIAACVALLLAGAAAAQNGGFQPAQPAFQPQLQPPVFNPYGSATATLVLQKAVQDDIKATPEQVAKFQEIQQANAQALRDLKNLQPADRAQKVKEIQEKTAKDIEAVLKPEQLKRLEQISFQSMIQGSPAVILSNKKAMDALKLSDEQIAKVRDLSTEQIKALQEVFKGGVTDPQEMMKKLQEVRGQVVGKFEAILDAEQKKKLKDLMGEPFKGANTPFGVIRPVPLPVEPPPIQPRQPREPKQLPGVLPVVPEKNEQTPPPIPFLNVDPLPDPVQPVQPVPIQIQPIQIEIQPVQPIRPVQPLPVIRPIAVGRGQAVVVGLGGKTAETPVLRPVRPIQIQPIRPVQIQPGVLPVVPPKLEPPPPPVPFALADDVPVQVQPLQPVPIQLQPVRRVGLPVGLGGATQPQAAPIRKPIQVKPVQIKPIQAKPIQINPNQVRRLQSHVVGLGGATQPTPIRPAARLQPANKPLRALLAQKHVIGLGLETIQQPIRRLQLKPAQIQIQPFQGKPLQLQRQAPVDLGIGANVPGLPVRRPIQLQIVP